MLTDKEKRRQIEMLIEHMSDEEVGRAYERIAPAEAVERCGMKPSHSGYPCVKPAGHTDRHQHALGGWWINNEPHAEPDCAACGGSGESRTTMLTTNPPRPAPCERCHRAPRLGVMPKPKPKPEPLPAVVEKSLDIVTDVNQHLVAANARQRRVIVEAYEMLRRPGVEGAIRTHNSAEILRREATTDDAFINRLRGEVTA